MPRACLRALSHIHRRGPRRDRAQSGALSTTGAHLSSGAPGPRGHTFLLPTNAYAARSACCLLEGRANNAGVRPSFYTSPRAVRFTGSSRKAGQTFVLRWSVVQNRRLAISTSPASDQGRHADCGAKKASGYNTWKTFPERFHSEELRAPALYPLAIFDAPLPIRGNLGLSWHDRFVSSSSTPFITSRREGTSNETSFGVTPIARHSSSFLVRLRNDSIGTLRRGC